MITLSLIYTYDSGWLESNQFLGICYVNLPVDITVHSSIVIFKYRKRFVIKIKITLSIEMLLSYIHVTCMFYIYVYQNSPKFKFICSAEQIHM